MLTIKVPDMNDSLSRLTIDGKVYGLRFTYNGSCGYWSFGLHDENGAALIAAVRLVPNFPIFHPYTDTRLPSGVFGCLSKSDTVGRQAFLDGTAEFVYIPKEELEESNGEL